MSDNSESSKSSTPSDPLSDSKHVAQVARPGDKLAQCLLSQCAFTTTGVVAATGYAICRKPKNGILYMLMAGTMGTAADLVAGWTYNCTDQVREWQQPATEHSRDNINNNAETKENEMSLMQFMTMSFKQQIDEKEVNKKPNDNSISKEDGSNNK